MIDVGLRSRRVEIHASVRRNAEGRSGGIFAALIVHGVGIPAPVRFLLQQEKVVSLEKMSGAQSADATAYDDDIVLG